MRGSIGLLAAFLMTLNSALADDAIPVALIAPGGTLRAAYIESNLAQMARDPATGAFRGVSADIARELGRRAAVPVTITPVPTAAAVLESVRSGAADIGFVAPNPARMGVVAYTQTYMLVGQSFLVPDGSAITAVAQVDAPGNVVGANTDDSVSTYMKQNFKHATVRETPDTSIEIGARWLTEGTIVAFAGNRQRLGVSAAALARRGIGGIHLLPDNLYGVPQTIAVSTQRGALLAALNAALDDMRASGFLARAVAGSGADGIEVAPAAK